MSDAERIKALRLALDQLLFACERDSYEIRSTELWAAYHFAGNIMNEAHSRPVEPCPFYGTPCEYVAAGGRVCALIDAARLEGIRLGLEAAWHQINGYGFEDDMHFALDPATIAREAVLDKLAGDAQEQGMGYDRNVRYGVEVVRPPSAPLIAREADQ